LVPKADQATVLPGSILQAASNPDDLSASAMPPTIGVLVLSAVADDPRVRRHCDAFHRAGWNVIAVGLPGARSPAPGWPIVRRDLTAPAIEPGRGQTAEPSDGGACRQVPGRRPIGRRRVKGAVPRPARGSKTRRRLLGPAVRVRDWLWLLAVRIRPQLAHAFYWSRSSNIRDFYACARDIKAAVWLANDWIMLPLAARLAREHGGIYGYDTHEFAVEEFHQKFRWRLLQRPMICVLEGAFIGDAAVVSAVSAGIGEQLDRLYEVRRPTIVVRNTPAFEATPFRPTAERVRVLYHGIVAPGRGLELAIDSVADWRPEFDLTIRGPGDPGYIDQLRRRMATHRVMGRVRLAPPEPMTELVRAAKAFDIGFFALPGSSRHNKFALPNKFFEYVMAGLALCVSELPEMARLVRRYDLGITIARADREAVSAAINSLDRQCIDRYKQNALAAARELCWERESERLVAAYEAALQRARS
jgi:glycosyltransferase involved in cell wall biosynthesis